MKKVYVFLNITLILFFVYACSITIPSEVEVTGSPSLKFAANLSFSEYFADMSDKIAHTDEKTKVLPCTNPALDSMAFVLRMKIFEKEDYRFDTSGFNLSGDNGNISIDIGEGLPPVNLPVTLPPGGTELTLTANQDITESDPDDPFILSFMSIDQYLEGFEFKGIQAKIYISGTQLADVLRIDLHKVNKVGLDTPLVSGDELFEKGPSGLESLTEYTGINLPDKGEEIPISGVINSGGDLALGYKIYIKAGTKIDLEWLNESHHIVAEIALWLPMKFDTTQPNAVLKFPELFDGVGDVLKSLAGKDFIEDINMNIALEPINPFISGSGDPGFFVIHDTGCGDIKFPLDPHSINIIFTEEQLEYINNNPFNPTFFILYPNPKIPFMSSELKIPSGDLSISTVTLNARLKYNMEL